MDVITFDKSFQQRYTEFTDVLSDSDVLPASKLQKQWGFFLELTLDKIGWQAIWKIPRLTCESLNVPFPSVALVIVLTINTKELSAYVRILATKNDLIIPEKNWVSLTQLWPTKEQDKAVLLNLWETANSLDMFRFFYFYVYMPWDRDDDDGYDWKEKHLESRLRFYYDLKNGSIPKAVAEHYHQLLTEARRLHHRREYLEEQFHKQEDFEEDMKDDKFKTLMKIHVRLQEIRAEIEIGENPILRNVIIERISQLNLVTNPSQSVHQVWLISNTGTADQHIDFLSKVKQQYSKENLNLSTNLASVLKAGNYNDTYLLNESTHTIVNTGALEKGGVLKGIGSMEKVVLTTEIEDVMFNFIGENVVIENLTIDVASAQCGILVKAGKCTIRNCKIFTESHSSVHQGILVLKGAQLVLEKCEIFGFPTAIVGNSGSVITLANCNIYNVGSGLKIFDNTAVTLESVVLKDCSEFAIDLETATKDEAVGDFQCLEKVPEVKFKNVTGVNNGRGNVAILPPPKLQPFEDLFSDPNKDPTIIESDNDEGDDSGI
ncbi:unnamed protein product [Phyllotreta striolata]|uniref:Right handed beta helix domain-containing protein n=1 Tax=Phyllotreta striolata TaxID=444603 RepID=A0A9N9XI32_PHYSR|nr:unnamed protein product [Phyllotreta striolata]